MSYLPCVEIEPSESANAAVIWLHGLGASGHDFAPLVPQLTLPSELAVRFVLPHAPSIPVTVNGGYVMPAWYDIYAMTTLREVDTDRLRQSAHEVGKLIEREIERGIDSRRIVLAGFSQGGAVVYHAALTQTRPLGGLLVLSSYLATADTMERDPVNQSLPVLIQHGVQDPVVPEILGQQAADQLRAWQYPVQYQRYPVEHGVCPQQIPVISRWLGECLTRAYE
ncbi:alpha/beta hydrolase [Marinimicrobium sp. ABcell2]|uniref:alpha/beta hydrolase n=1 Tax=Marinimicrobium sp. ABcell2 TaxID=3069751 RepID=UPI0027B34F64|nr:alpha/beta fold hydrolase [Marinimicrobium sp. ABcell2]MDQ2077894.1 alpha/beta fold hydrolase [Marinimicrobium sp. ABcell2]